MYMENPMIDTLAYSKKLQAAGVPQEIAEAQATIFAEVIQGRLTTKDELKDEISGLRNEMHHEFQNVRHEMQSLEERLNHRIDNVTYQLTIRLGGLMAVGITILATLHKFIG